MKELTEGNPAKVIILFAIPIIIGNICQQIYNVVDTIIVGRFVSYHALAGIGAINGLNFVILNFFLGLTEGLSIKTAQYFGARDKERMRKSVGTSLMICIAFTVLMSIVSTSLTDSMLHLINTPEDVFPFARDYITIIFTGMVALVAYNMIACILRAVGDSRTPLYFLIFASVVNIGLDLLFILTFNLGIKGAAAATVTSQLISAVLCFAYAFNRFPDLRISFKDMIPSRTDIREHLRISLPMAFQFSIIGIGIIVLQYALNGFPSTYIAGFTAGSKVQNLCISVGISIGMAMASYVGQNYGARAFDRIKKGVNAALVICLGVCIVVCTIMTLFAEPLTSMFLEKEIGEDATEIYYASKTYLKMCAIFFPFLFSIFVYRNALQGMGKTTWPLISGFLELVIRTVVALTLPAAIGYMGIPLTDASSWTGASLFLLTAYYISLHKAKAKHNFK